MSKSILCNCCGKEIPEDINDYVYVDETDMWYCDKACFYKVMDYYESKRGDDYEEIQKQ